MQSVYSTNTGQKAVLSAVSQYVQMSERVRGSKKREAAQQYRVY